MTSLATFKVGKGSKRWGLFDAKSDFAERKYLFLCIYLKSGYFL